MQSVGSAVRTGILLGSAVRSGSKGGGRRVPDYRRAYVPGGMYFFTLVTERRAPILTDPNAREFLRQAFVRCRSGWPFRIEAIVLLPDHLHAIWSLPRGDANYSLRWAWIKKEFTKSWIGAGGSEEAISASRRRNRRRGVWQRRFWEHCLEDEDDLERHCDYIHYNPVKHGLVRARWSGRIAPSIGS
jgi:REP-associated tyrosine transposase